MIRLIKQPDTEQQRQEKGDDVTYEGEDRYFHCQQCGRELVRGRGDVSCDCGAEYNASGQRLRDDWRNNPSAYDEEIGDMEGYEIEHAGDS